MITSRVLIAAFAMLGLVAPSQDKAASPPKARVRAKYLITVADDFVVDVYLNGRVVPDTSRKLVAEQFGATVERIDMKVRQGDWLVFNVVNNRLRWGGVRYFALAGCRGEDDFAFVSDFEESNWSVCDEPAYVPDFIADPAFGAHRHARSIDLEWQDGTPLMKQFAGDSWNGKPLWGTSRNTWIKMRVR